MKKPVVVWFRNNQRLHDNPALSEAISSGCPIAPIYVIDDRLFEQNSFGIKRAGIRRLKFLGDSLLSLQKSLETIGGYLHVVKGNPAEEVIRFANQINADEIYAPNGYGTEELYDEKRVSNSGKKLHLFHQELLIHPSDVNFDVRETPDIFTVFRKKCEKHALPRQEALLTNNVDFHSFSASNQEIEKLTSLEADYDDFTAIPFNAGEQQGLERLNYYLWESDAVATYKETRNELIGSDYSTKFSVWLALGNLSPRKIYHEIKKYELERKKNQSTYWVIFELLWRDYFKYVFLKYQKRLFWPSGIKQEIQSNAGTEYDFMKWMKGKTGVPFIDANIKEMNQTGFMSNRGRQNVASYLVKDLGLSWLKGAEYFEHHLVDFDACSNYGNWQYVAGIGNDPRENRYFNVVLQAKRYDPNAEYILTWNPELHYFEKSELFEPWQYHKEFDRPKFNPSFSA